MEKRTSQRDLKMRGGLRVRWGAVLFAAVVALALVTVALAGGVVAPRAPEPVTVTKLPVATAQPALTVARPPVLQCKGVDLKAERAGAKVPLSCFGALPQKTSANTATPKATAKHARYHPMAATGATIDLTSVSNCGTTGAIYQIGCSLQWEATNLGDWSTTDTYEDYYVAPNSQTATQVSATAYAYNAATAHTQTLSLAGTYTFFVYDTTKSVIVAIVYVDAGSAFTIGTYADPYHVTPASQFSVVSDSDVYIYLPNVSTNDTYVVYVMSTSVNAYCVYITPAATPSPGPASPMPTGSPNGLICNPANSVGISAPGGALSLAWPLSESLQAGTYSIVVYDKTQNETMGQAQVSLTGISEYSFELYPTPGTAPSPAAPATPPNTKFAWDSTTEQSDAGIVATLPNQLSGTYRMTATDPDGQVVAIPVVSPNPIPATCTTSSNSSALCTETGTFLFASANPALFSPSDYPNNIWTMQLINTANNTVESSQSFQILGYKVETEFDNAGTYGQTINFPSTGTVDEEAGIGLYFLNEGNTAYPNAYDTISGIEYTTGPTSSLTGGAFTTLSNTAGYGTTFTLPSCTGSYTTGCTQSITDSAGHNWTATEYCSTTTPTTPGINSQCVLKLAPGSGVVLAGGGSITITGINWYADSGNADWCTTPCTATTSILPTDGVSWSSTTAGSPAWTQTYFSATNAAIIGTASAHYIGSCPISACTSGAAKRYAVAFATSPPTTPWTNTHYYQTYFTQGDYTNSEPFPITAGTEDILVISLTDCTGSGAPAPSCTGASSHNLDEIGITFPPGIPASEITVDALEPNIPAETYAYKLSNGTVGSAGNDCNGTLPANSICLNPDGVYNDPGVTYNGSATDAQGQIWLDVPEGEASFIAQNLQIQSWNITEATWTSLTADGHTSAATTPVVGGGVAGAALDSLSLQQFSLNYNLMSAQFDPSTISPGASTTNYSLVFSNTSTAADVNPDPVDAIVVEQLTSSGWTLSAPTFSGTGSGGWSNLSGTGYNVAGNDMEYWFGVCSTQYTNHTTANTGPPQAPPNPTFPTGQQGLLGAQCTAAQEEDAIAAGGSLTINFALTNTTTGTQTFYVYAHGANGGGWSAPKTVTVTSSKESASAKFFSFSPVSADTCPTTSNVATNTVTTVSSSTNCYIYEVTNTSESGTDIGVVNITLPAYDINGIATSGSAWDLFGTTTTEYVELGSINTSGTFVQNSSQYGCSINASTTATFNPTPGSTNGQIQVTGCTSFASGDNIAVEFVADTPQSENDSYLFPSTVDGVASGLAWTGSDEVTVSFTLGLSIAVDPSNPGPGGSTPTVTCNPAQCTFSGETVDFGSIATANTVTGTDLVRATVVYGGSTISATCPAGAGTTANTWQLQVQYTGGATTQLSMDEDETNSKIGSGTWGTAAGTLGTTAAAGAEVLACGNYTSGTDYDMLSNFSVTPTSTTGTEVTVTYTLIGN